MSDFQIIGWLTSAQDLKIYRVITVTQRIEHIGSLTLRKQFWKNDRDVKVC